MYLRNKEQGKKRKEQAFLTLSLRVPEFIQDTSQSHFQLNEHGITMSLLLLYVMAQIPVVIPNLR